MDIPNSSGQTCLHVACKVGDEEIARMILDKSRNINTKDIRFWKKYTTTLFNFFYIFLGVTKEST